LAVSSHVSNHNLQDLPINKLVLYPFLSKEKRKNQALAGKKGVL